MAKSNQHGLSEEHLKVLKEALSPFAERIDKVGLFGSRAVGNFRPASDIDMVIYGSLDEKASNSIFTVLNDSYLPVKVDVQVYHRIISPLLKEHIDAVMLPIFTREQLNGF